jgi:hypothetical protein
MTILEEGITGYGQMYYVYTTGANSGKLAVDCWSRGWYYSSALITADQWNHVAFVYSATNQKLKFYINGIYDLETTAYSSTGFFDTDDIYIGGDPLGSSGNYYNGQIDDVRVYNRVLSEDEISAIYESYNPKIQVSDLQKGLIGYWRFDGSAKDSTPYSNNATVFGSILATDRKGQGNKSYYFDGSDDYMNAGSGTDLNFVSGDFTISLWFKAGDTSGTLVERGLSQTDGYTLMYDPYIHLLTHQLGGYTYCRSQHPVTNGVWEHWVSVRDGTSIKLYRNGVEDIPYTGGNCVAITDPITSTRPFIIGTGNTWGISSGQIDDVRIYNRALSSDEVVDLYEIYQ